MLVHLLTRLVLVGFKINEIFLKMSGKFWRWVLGQLSQPTGKIWWWVLGQMSQPTAKFMILAVGIGTIVQTHRKIHEAEAGGGGRDLEDICPTGGVVL